MNPTQYPLPEGTILLPEHSADIIKYTPGDYAEHIVEKETEAHSLPKYTTPYDTVRSESMLKHRSYLEALQYYIQTVKLYIDRYRPYALLEKKVVPGTDREYREVIHHTTTTHFGLWERIKILFGKPVVVRSELYASDDSVHIVGSKAIGHVPPLYTRTIRKGGGLSAPLSAPLSASADSEGKKRPKKDEKTL
jgi:hypothetical protein